MGENARVDPDRLRSLADRVTAAAADVTDLSRPELTGGLAGSAVAGAVARQPVSARLDDIAVELLGWAAAARRSAELLEDADRANAERFPAR